MWNLLLDVLDFTEVPLSHLRCQLPFQGSLIEKKPPLKGEGDQRSWWRGFLWNLLLDVLGFTEAPLSQACGLPAPLSGEPITNKPPLKGEGDRR